MRRKFVPPVVWTALAVPVLWAAVLAAGVYESGVNLFELLRRLLEAAGHPFFVRWTVYIQHLGKYQRLLRDHLEVSYINRIMWNKESQ